MSSRKVVKSRKNGDLRLTDVQINRLLRMKFRSFNQDLDDQFEGLGNFITVVAIIIMGSVVTSVLFVMIFMAIFFLGISSIGVVPASVTLLIVTVLAVFITMFMIKKQVRRVLDEE